MSAESTDHFNFIVTELEVSTLQFAKYRQLCDYLRRVIKND